MVVVVATVAIDLGCVILVVAFNVKPIKGPIRKLTHMNAHFMCSSSLQYLWVCTNSPSYMFKGVEYAKLSRKVVVAVLRKVLVCVGRFFCRLL